MNRKDILLILRTERQNFVDRYNIAWLAIFGSVARDEARPESDVDLIVEFEHPVGLLQFIELQQHLERILGCKVDLGTKRSLKSRIKDQVLREAIRVA